VPLLRLICCVLALAPTLFVSGCSTTSIIGQIETPPELSTKILPIRTLKVLVAYDDPSDLDGIRKVLDEASTILKKQIGVELETLPAPVVVTWGKRGYNPMLGHLELVTKHREPKFDIAIGFARRSNTDLHCIDGSWAAVIENGYRRFIVSQELHPWFIAHEVAHAFVFSHTHSPEGLLKASASLILPGVYALAVDDYRLTAEDLDEALRNKWRKFGERVTVVSDGPVPEKCAKQ